MNTAASATLSAHSGAIKMSRHQVSLIEAPPRTVSHVPVRHSELIDTIELELRRNNISIVKDEYAVQDDGMKLFGAFTLNHQTQDDFTFAMGFRASNDRTLPISFVVGLRVFVCDNLALSGDSIVLKRRHTSNLNLQFEISQGIDRAIDSFGQFENLIDGLKDQEISDDRAKALILDGALSGVYPLRILPLLNNEYFKEEDQKFPERTLWSLHNSGTEAFKELRPNIAFAATQEWGKMFGI